MRWKCVRWSPQWQAAERKEIRQFVCVRRGRHASLFGVGRVAVVDVLVIGSGAREHALCRALSLDPDVDRLVCAPGNAGTAAVATNVAVDAGDPDAIAALGRVPGRRPRGHRP